MRAITFLSSEKTSTALTASALGRRETRGFFGGPAMVGIAPAEERYDKSGINERVCGHSQSTSGIFSSVRSALAANHELNR
jgi:hypothetical protein